MQKDKPYLSLVSVLGPFFAEEEMSKWWKGLGRSPVDSLNPRISEYITSVAKGILHM